MTPLFNVHRSFNFCRDLFSSFSSTGYNSDINRPHFMKFVKAHYLTSLLTLRSWTLALHKLCSYVKAVQYQESLLRFCPHLTLLCWLLIKPKLTALLSSGCMVSLLSFIALYCLSSLLKTNMCLAEVLMFCPGNCSHLVGASSKLSLGSQTLLSSVTEGWMLLLLNPATAGFDEKVPP